MAIIQRGVTEIVGVYYKYSCGSSAASGAGKITCLHTHTHTFSPQNLMECEVPSTVQNADAALY